MRICLVSRKVNLTGGIGRYVYELCRFFSARHHDVHLYVSRYDAPRIEGVSIHHVPMIYGSLLVRMRLHALANLLQVASFSLASLFLVPRGEYDIVHVQGDSLVMPDVRTAHSCHLFWIKMARKKATSPASKLVKSLLNPLHLMIAFIELKDFRNSSRVIAVSERTAGEVAGSYGIDPEKIAAIPNGVDTGLFHPDNRERWRKPVRERYGIGDEEWVIIFVAAEFRRKGLGVLIDALRDMETGMPQEEAGRPEDKRIVLLVAGGDKRDAYETQVRRSGLQARVIFTDHVPEIETLFAAADIFVLPSVYEPFGLVLTESMASGLPVVTTDRVGAVSLIEDGRTGFIVDSRDVRSGLTRVLRDLVDNGDKAERVGAAGRTVVENLTWDDVGVMTEDVYREVAGTVRGAPRRA